MELSILCGVKVFLYVMDSQMSRVVHYQAEKSDNIRQVLNKQLQVDNYFNNDVRIKSLINSSKIVRQTHHEIMS